MPFLDQQRDQNVSFVNLPLDPATSAHREIAGAADIPPPGGGPQTALIGSTYVGPQNVEVSPDTSAKTIPEDSSYAAPQGGVLAQMSVQVAADQAGRGVMYFDVDDGEPNGPGSSIIVLFSSEGIEVIDGPEITLGDGFHGEGVPCLVVGAVPTVDTTPTPLPPLVIRDREIPLAAGMTYIETTGSSWCNLGVSGV